MNIDKYNIEYLEAKWNSKPVFIFVNHKTGVLCWAKIKEISKKRQDVITFDSHKDSFSGAILIPKGKYDWEVYRSNYLENKKPKHFTTNKEFLDWDLLKEEQNKEIITNERKFLVSNNDNIFDVAFMKDIIGNVYWYYIEAPWGGKSHKCDDLNGNVHSYVMGDISKIKKPSKDFILDIDLDFYAKLLESSKFELFSDEIIDKYLRLQKNLADSNLCVGITIALEPNFCGGMENCLIILDKFSEIFGIDLRDEGKRLIERATEEV